MNVLPVNGKPFYVENSNKEFKFILVHPFLESTMIFLISGNNNTFIKFITFWIVTNEWYASSLKAFVQNLCEPTIQYNALFTWYLPDVFTESGLVKKMILFPNQKTEVLFEKQLSLVSYFIDSTSLSILNWVKASIFIFVGRW